MSDTAIVSYDTKHTAQQYTAFQEAYDYFNAELFDNTLPQCLITLQRKNTARGYFSSERFAHRVDDMRTDEIAMNPSHFGRSDKEILSTLVHEMVHLWQYHFAAPSRARYHNKEWAEKMIAVGLQPSDTGEPGGKMTGQRVTHYIIPGGPYEQAVDRLLARGFRLMWQSQETMRSKGTPSKIAYVCAECGQKAWAKPNAHLICGDCEIVMQSGQ